MLANALSPSLYKSKLLAHDGRSACTDIKATLDTAGSTNKSPPSGALDPISAESAQLYHMLPV